MKLTRNDDRTPGWDTRACVKAAQAWGGLTQCYVFHGWPVTPRLMMHIGAHAKREYGSIEGFGQVAAQRRAEAVKELEAIYDSHHSYMRDNGMTPDQRAIHNDIAVGLERLIRTQTDASAYHAAPRRILPASAVAADFTSTDATGYLMPNASKPMDPLYWWDTTGGNDGDAN